MRVGEIVSWLSCEQTHHAEKYCDLMRNALAKELKLGERIRGLVLKKQHDPGETRNKNYCYCHYSYNYYYYIIIIVKTYTETVDTEYDGCAR